MRIWLIQTGEMLPLTSSDRRMRTGHLAYELARRGHQVIWWSSSFDHMSKKWIEKKDTTISLFNNLEIKLIKSIGYQKNVSVKRYIDHWLLASKFKKQIKTETLPDIIIASLPDHHLAYESTRYALKHDIPIIIDLRDLWPDLFVDVIKRKIIKLLVKILLVRDYWKARFSMRHAHGLVTMMNYYLQKGSELSGRRNNKNDRVFYIGAEKSAIKTPKNIRKEIDFIVSSVREKFVVLYIGTFNRICHPKHLINSARYINTINKNNEIEFILAGDGEYFEKLKKLASDCSNVKFTGWINNDEISALLKIASVGVVTTNEPFIGFVNKVFTYLSGSLPIISSLEGEVKDLIQNEGIGYSYQYNQYEDLAEKILFLEKDRGLRNTMASNSEKLFDYLFDSRKIYSSYADYIENMNEKKP